MTKRDLYNIIYHNSQTETCDLLLKSIKKMQICEDDMYKILKNINAYITYLNQQCDLHTSIHFGEKRLGKIPEQYLAILLEYNSHVNPYCMKVKSVTGNHQKCVLAQKSVLESQRTESFCRVCHAGVYEFIGPICENGRVVGFVAVSGYKKESHIPVELCEVLVPPLCSMVELFLIRCVEADSSEYNLMLQYLNEYHTNVTLEDLSKHFGRSKSYISHMFKKSAGVSIREYCNHLKLEDAKRILLSTDKPITEVTYDVGFHDVSYFVHLFKEKYGESPLQYRKRYREA